MKNLLAILAAGSFGFLLKLTNFGIDQVLALLKIGRLTVPETRIRQFCKHNCYTLAPHKDVEGIRTHEVLSVDPTNVRDHVVNCVNEEAGNVLVFVVHAAGQHSDERHRAILIVGLHDAANRLRFKIDDIVHAVFELSGGDLQTRNCAQRIA